MGDMQNKLSIQSYLRRYCLIILLTGLIQFSFGQLLPGFQQAKNVNEQEIDLTNVKEVTMNINSPLHLNSKGKTYLVIFALPNGNSIEWTKGKKMSERTPSEKPGDDWHFDIQHIAAQMRYVRTLDKKNNYIIAYLMANQKSWPTWKRSTTGSILIIKNIVDSLAERFKMYSPKIILNGHSGGGSFIFGYLDAVEKIPSSVERIAFPDSDYGYEDSLHTKKITDWLLEHKKNKLVVLAYNDSLVIFNGKPLVSPTGGTWYRSRLMQRKLSSFFSFSTKEDTSFIKQDALNGRLKIILKKNPAGLIYHTVQVEKNGFIFSLLSATRYDRKKYFIYFGDRAYEKLIDEQ